MQISIIICCYNSASRITPTLNHLAIQELNDLKCEVIIVDNNCTDKTIEIAKRVWEDCGNPFTLKIVKENKPGLSFARRTGVETAKGQIVVFCDDDNWLDENYLINAYTIMKENQTIGVLGGKGVAVSDDMFPDWFESVKSHYAIGKQADISGDITNRRYVWGAGMVLRRLVFIDIIKSGFKSYLIDRIGNNLSSGGDSEISMWFILWGSRLSYSDQLVFKHFIPANRLTESYYKQLKNGLDLSISVLDNYNYILQYKYGNHRFRNNLLNLIYTLFKILYYRLIKRDKNYSNYLYNIFLLYSYNFIPSNSLLSIMAKDILPKVDVRYPNNYS